MKMIEAKEMSKLRKMQLSQLMTHMGDGAQKNRKQAESKLSGHLSKMRKLFDDYEANCKR